MTIRLHRTDLLGHLYGLLVGGYAVISALADAAHLPSRPISIVLRIAVAVFALGVMRVGWVQGKIYRGKFWQLYWVFWLMLGLRLAWDLGIAKVDGLYYEPLAYVAYAVLFCMVPMAAMFTEPDLDKPNIRVPMVYGVVGVILQFGTNTILHPPTLAGRMHGDYFDPIQLGHLSASVIIMAAWVLLNNPPHYGVPKWGLAIGFILGLVTQFTAASRGPLISLVAVAIVFTFTFLRGKRLLYGIVGLIAFATVLGGVAYVTETLMGYRMITRLIGVTDGDVNTESRRDFQKQAIKDFVENPATGKSITISKYSMYPHNLVIESFMSLGVLGGMSFIAILLWGFSSAVYLIRIKSLYGWLGLLYLQWMFGGFFSGNLYAWDHMWVYLAAIVAIGFAERRRRSVGTISDRVAFAS